MADIAGTFVGPLVELIVKKIEEEVTLLNNYDKDFKQLKFDMEFLNCCFQYVASKGKPRKDPVRLWLASVEKAALDAEDIIDEVVLHERRKELSIFHSYYSFSSLDTKFRDRIANKIEEFKNSMQAIRENAGTICLVESLQSPQQIDEEEDDEERRKSSVLYEESKTVGMQDRINHVIETLSSPTRRIIAVVGMGGLGKTLLLQHVFKAIKNDYEFFAWKCVSNYPDIKRIQSSICQQIQADFNVNGSEEAIARVIYDRLRGKRCLIVLDDIWVEKGILRKIGIPDEDSCKVFISTRNEEVASKLEAYVYRMETLSPEVSKELFRRYAYPEHQDAPDGIKELADEIIEFCKGLPVALKTTAASLRNETSIIAWRDKLKQMKSLSCDDSQDSHMRVIEILRLSYEALPPVLKRCFECFAQFKEDFVESSDDVIDLWLFMGILSGGDKNPYEYGRSLLAKLSNRCLIAVDPDSWGQPIRMHDLLHSTACRVFTENKGFIYNANQSKPSSSSSSMAYDCLNKKDDCLRMKIFLEDTETLPKGTKCPPSLRNLSVDGSYLTGLPNSFLSDLKLLRILDLSLPRNSKFPKGIEQMKLLRCLNLRRSKITKCPDCVKDLLLLESLRLPGIKELPQWIGRLQGLIELTWVGDVWPPRNDIVWPPHAVSNLKNLCKLGGRVGLKMEGTPNKLSLSHLALLTNLWELDLSIEDQQTADAISRNALSALKKLRRLTLYNVSEGAAVLELDDNMPEVLKDLHYLFISRFKLPKSISHFTQLQTLTLFNSHVEDYGDLGLERLPCLAHLIISRRICEEFPESFGKAGAFPRLVELWLYDCWSLKKMPSIEEGGMPCLKSAFLGSCPNLRDGEGKDSLIAFFDAVVTLKEVSLRYFPDEFKQFLKARFPKLSFTTIKGNRHFFMTLP